MEEVASLSFFMEFFWLKFGQRKAILGLGFSPAAVVKKSLLYLDVMLQFLHKGYNSLHWQFLHGVLDQVVVGPVQTQIWPLTQFYCVDFIKSGIGVKSAFSTNEQQTTNELFLAVSWDFHV